MHGKGCMGFQIYSMIEQKNAEEPCVGVIDKKGKQVWSGLRVYMRVFSGGCRNKGLAFCEQRLRCETFQI
jgi:hypothetical protein